MREGPAEIVVELDTVQETVLKERITPNLLFAHFAGSLSLPLLPPNIVFIKLSPYNTNFFFF